MYIGIDGCLGVGGGGVIASEFGNYEKVQDSKSDIKVYHIFSLNHSIRNYL